MKRNVFYALIFVLCLMFGQAVYAEAIDMQIDIKAFGAHSIDENGYENFDSSDAIQKALDMGGTINFGSGTYNVKKQLEISSNTTIISSGATLNKMFNIDNSKHLFVTKGANPENITIRDITLNLKPNGSIQDKNAAAFLIEKKADNIQIENVTFLNTGNEVVKAALDIENNTYFTNITIKNNKVFTVDKPTGPMIWFQRVDGYTIDGNYISKGKGQVWCRLSKNGKIINNIFEGIANYWQEDCHLGGIELYYGCDNIVIDSNILKSNGILNDPNIVAIRSKNNSNITITNNNITWSNIGSEAINIRKDETYDINPYNHYVRKNVITGDTTIGIRLISIVSNSRIHDVFIENNVMENKSIVLHGTLKIENVSYDNIHINNNVSGKIVSHRFNNSNCEITNNTIIGSTGTGIIVRNMKSSVVKGNKIIGTSSLFDFGIDYSYSTGMQVAFNEFKNVKADYNAIGYNGIDNTLTAQR